MAWEDLPLDMSMDLKTASYDFCNRVRAILGKSKYDEAGFNLNIYVQNEPIASLEIKFKKVNRDERVHMIGFDRRTKGKKKNG